ncbi:MAG: glycine cleavage system protein GcvH [Deltaproteobacteria bacterium]|nr:glycine cleavage system protein GcvH [Deltaproteobacteria bacterium]
MSENIPNGLLYTEDHEWARVEGKIATIGITQFAVDQLGDVTQVDLPREGESIKKGDVFGSVESVKAVSDLFAPVTGKILKINTPLADSPEYINEEPYDQGWLIQVELADATETEGLMDGDAYETFLQENAD